MVSVPRILGALIRGARLGPIYLLLWLKPKGPHQLLRLG